jgi:hypothetical protein
LPAHHNELKVPDQRFLAINENHKSQVLLYKLEACEIFFVISPWAVLQSDDFFLFIFKGLIMKNCFHLPRKVGKGLAALDV